MLRFLNTLFAPARFSYAVASICLMGRDAHRGEMAQLTPHRRLFTEALVGNVLIGLMSIVIYFGAYFIRRGSLL